MKLLALIIGGVIIYFIVQHNRKENERQQRIRVEEESKRQQEEERHIANKKYDRIINCPACQGRGKTFIARYESVARDPDNEYLPDLLIYRVFPDNNYEEICRYIDDYRQNSDGTMRLEPPYMKDCLYCQGKGIAYAWFEKDYTYTEICGTCGGKGKVTVQVKLDIGSEQQEVSCEKCRGTGKLSFFFKEIVHVQTLSGANVACGDAEERGIRYPALMEDYALQVPFQSYEKLSKPGEEKASFKFWCKITDDNRDFFSKSKPR